MELDTTEDLGAGMAAPHDKNLKVYPATLPKLRQIDGMWRLQNVTARPAKPFCSQRSIVSTRGRGQVARCAAGVLPAPEHGQDGHGT